MKKYLVLFFLLLAGVVFAQSAEELYEGAVNKYFLGDNAGAVVLLRRVLADQPDNDKARVLLQQIESEGAAPVVATPTTVKRVVATTLRRAAATTTTLPKEKTKEEKANEYFIKAQEFFENGDYLIAKAYFRRVLDLVPDQQEAQSYLDEYIPERIALITKMDEAKEAVKDIRTKIEAPAFLLYLLVSLVLVFGFLFGLNTLYCSWRGKHLYCPECSSRNHLNAEFCRKCGYRLRASDLSPEQNSWFCKFNWSKNPFTLNVIPEAYAGHKTEISMIAEKLATLSGHILIVGGLGTGKTTLLQWMENHLKEKFETIYLLRPPARTDELIDLVAATITRRTNHTHRYSIYEFQKLCRQYKRNILLLLDEAHEFNEEFEQFLRTLGDLPNMYLVMAGLPQAREKLKRDLPALFDRIVETVLLGSLTQQETKELILNRIKNAGGEGFGPFTVAATEKIFDLGYGIPRGILKICDWLVTRAVRANQVSIEAKDVEAYTEQIKMAKLGEDLEMAEKSEEKKDG